MPAFTVHPEVERLQRHGFTRPATEGEPVHPGMTARPATAALRAHRRRRLRNALAVRAVIAIGVTPEHTVAGRSQAASGRAQEGRSLLGTQPLVSATAVSELCTSLLSSRRSAREGQTTVRDTERLQS